MYFCFTEEPECTAETGCADNAHCVLEPEPHCVCDTGYRGDGEVQCQGTFLTQNHWVAANAHCVLKPGPHCVCDTGYRGMKKSDVKVLSNLIISLSAI